MTFDTWKDGAYPARVQTRTRIQLEMPHGGEGKEGRRKRRRKERGRRKGDVPLANERLRDFDSYFGALDEYWRFPVPIIRHQNLSHTLERSEGRGLTDSRDSSRSS